MDRLLKPGQVDIIFRYPTGRTKRLIKKGKINAITLPDGELRIHQSEVDRILAMPKESKRNTLLAGAV